MIGVIEKTLKKYGLISKKAIYSYNIYRRGEIVYFLVTENGDQFAVKVSKDKSLEKEYESTKEAFNALKNRISVPEPLCYSDEFGISLMISRGIRFAPITNALINKYTGVFDAGIYEYIDGSWAHFKVDRPKDGHASIINKIGTYFIGTAISSLLPEWFDLVGDQKLDSLGHVNQHGDFVVTNIGISPNNLSVIDWEDFGRLTLPGIDVLTICASCLGMEETKIERLIYHRDPRGLSEIINYFCTVYGIPYELFKELAPLYFTSFLYLKKRYGYGKKIINQAEKIALLLFKKIINERQGYPE